MVKIKLCYLFDVVLQKAGYIRDFYHFNQIFMMSKMVVTPLLMVISLWELRINKACVEGWFSGICRFKV